MRHAMLLGLNCAQELVQQCVKCRHTVDLQFSTDLVQMDTEGQEAAQV
jgi:hypothetical protein